MSSGAVSAHRRVSRVRPRDGTRGELPGLVLRSSVMTVVAAHDGFEIERRDATTPTYHPRRDGAPLCWEAFSRGLRDESALRRVLIETLTSADARAYFFECAPWREGSSSEVEWVLVPTRAFERTTPDPSPFREHLERSVGLVATFANLCGDATLVVPSESAGRAFYGHLASFVRGAPSAQVDALFAAVGAALCELRARTAATVWLSTAGLGVDWLHVRLDARPKYYRHAPYKRA